MEVVPRVLARLSRRREVGTTWVLWLVPALFSRWSARGGDPRREEWIRGKCCVVVAAVVVVVVVVVKVVIVVVAAVAVVVVVVVVVV